MVDQQGSDRLRHPRSVYLLSDGRPLMGASALLAIQNGEEGETIILRDLADIESLVEIILFRQPWLELELVRKLRWDGLGLADSLKTLCECIEAEQKRIEEES